MLKYKPGDRLEIETQDGRYTGILMERPELSNDNYLVIKLESGYNIGIHQDRIKKIGRIGAASKGDRFKTAKHKRDPGKPNISILATGGTIASRVDYLTGGVHSAFSADELISAVPELEEIANLHGVQIFNKFSENIVPPDWIKLARAAADEIKKGVDGIVITHGTDTLGYTSAALAFMLKTPVPVVLTGAQRSSDRGSSDAFSNLIHSVLTASQGKFSEVVVVMHGETSDTHSLIHPATRVRKLHTSRRDAFQTVNSKPLGRVSGGGIEFCGELKSSKKFKLDTKLEERVFLLKYFPGLKPEIIGDLMEAGYRGIVIEGTGLGHTSESFSREIKDATGNGVSVAMTPQTIHGRVNMNVYSTGRILQEAGVIPCEDMLPETAYVKLMWVLGHTKKQGKIREMMQTNYAREINERSEIAENINFNSEDV